MKNKYKTKTQLMKEMADLRRQIDITGRNRLEGELQKSLRKLQAVDMLAVHLQKRFNVEELLGEAVALACDIIGSKYAAIGIVDEKWKYEYFFQSGIAPGKYEEMMKQHGLPVGKGLLGYLLSTDEPLRIDEIRGHPHSVGFPEGHPVMKSFLGVPIKSGGKVTGRLYFANDEGGFSGDDEEIALVIADRIGLALETARLYVEEKRAAEELATLNRITTAVSGILPVKDLAEQALEKIFELELFSSEKKGVFFLADEEKKMLRMLTQAGIGEEIKEICAEIPYGECLCGITAENGEPLISADCFRDARHTKKYGGMAGHGHVNLPLKSGEKLLGVLTLYRPPGEGSITPREKSLLLSIGDIVSVALNNALHHKEVEYLASFPMENPYPIIELDEDCTITYFNPATEKFTAQFGLEISDLLPSDLCELVDELRSKDQTFAYTEIETPSRDLGAYISIRQGTGTTRGFIFDITERKRMESALAKHREELLALTQASNSLIEIVETGDTYTRICNIALEVFNLDFCWIGIREEEDPYIKPVSFAGRQEGYLDDIRIRWDDTPEGRGPAGSAFRTMKPYIVFDVETDPAFAPWREQALARGFRSIMSAPLIHRNEVMEVLTLYSVEPYFFTEDRTRIIQALTNQAAAALENSKLVKGLEETVRLRTSDLESEKLKAEEASKAKSVFLASMSHELRTPMNAILGFSQLLQERYFGDLTEKQAEYVNDILESGNHLLSLINDILDLSKVEAGKMELDVSDVDIEPLLENSLVMVKEKAMKHGIALELKTAPEMENLVVRADERKLKQVMFNLLSNAAKFTPDGGSIEVQAKLDGDQIIVSVTDTGIGMSSEECEKVFGEFYQVMKAGGAKTPGTGLGLPLMKAMVELHGGRVWAESEGEGKGSRFNFTLPVNDKSNVQRPMSKGEEP